MTYSSKDKKSEGNLQLQQFDFKFMPELVDRVKDLWTPPNAEEKFRRSYAEAVIRQDMHANRMQFQLLEKGEIRAIACASTKGEKNSAEIWWKEQFEKLTPEQQFSFNLSRDYLNLMEEKAYSFMTGEDVKLDLFISVKTGWGKKVLEVAMETFREQGFKNLFLWTDSDCNVNWYIQHGYELVDQEVYEPFSNEEEEYKTYIFKKKL